MSAVRMSSDDKLLIQEIFTRYAWAFDTSDAQAYANLFTEDATMEAPDGSVVTGRANIVPFIQRYMTDPKIQKSLHFNSGLLFEEGDDTRCTVRAYYNCMHWNAQAEEGYSRVLGTYYVKCVKIDGKWLFKERIHRHLKSDTVPAKGPSFAAALAGI